MSFSLTDLFYPLLAFGIALLAHYMIIMLSLRTGVFLDAQEKIQKAHEAPTPRIGGLGIFLAALFMAYEPLIGLPVLLAAIPTFFAGFIEDYSGRVSPVQRLAIMGLSPLMLMTLLPGLFFENQIFSSHLIYYGFALFVFVGLLAVINGLNFIDGHNGLAGGTALISVVSMAVLARMYAEPALFYILVIVAVAIFAFLIFNYPKGRIFLGDSGAYLLGFLLGALALVFWLSRTELSPVLFIALLIYPLWELAFSVIRKLFFERMSPLHSDRRHLHQLLRQYGGGSARMPWSLLMLPVQAFVSVLALFSAAHTGLLLGLSLAFIAVYTGLYVYLRLVLSGREQAASSLI